MDLNIRILDFNHNNMHQYKIAINLLLSNLFQYKIAMRSQFSNTLHIKNVIHPQLSIFSLLHNANMDVLNISKINLSPAFISNSLNYKDALDKDNQKALLHQLHVIQGILDAGRETVTNIYMLIFNQPLKMMPNQIRINRYKIRILIHQILNHLYAQNL